MSTTTHVTHTWGTARHASHAATSSSGGWHSVAIRLSATAAMTLLLVFGVGTGSRAAARDMHHPVLAPRLEVPVRR